MTKKLSLYNTLSRKVEEFHSVADPVTIYTCGPTVYDRKHIGNFRTYTCADLLVRVLRYNGYAVKHIMNLTDVGHLTGDNSGDSDTGVDRMEVASKREGKTAWDVAKLYGDMFIEDYKKLHLEPPVAFVKATDHIKEQIELIQVLESKELTYTITDGLYFDTLAFEKQTGNRYGELATLDEIQSGGRLESNPEKRNPRDFALWRFSPKDEKRDMEWDSPWGKGFPGWHIECSAMSLKYLTDAYKDGSFHPELAQTIDLHVGGEDLRQTHHPNEIAQSEGATGKKFVNVWVHGGFILIDGARMSTSKGNNYTVNDIISHGFSPLALRYLYLTVHYKKILNFTWESLQSAQNALNNLYSEISNYDLSHGGVETYEERFADALNDNLNMPEALAVMWELVRNSQIPSGAKMVSLEKFDMVLGLQLSAARYSLSMEERSLFESREKARAAKDFALSDQLRDELKKRGLEVNDSEQSSTWKKIFS